MIEKIFMNIAPDMWCERILEKTQEFERISPVEIIKDAGYDIAETAKWLTDFYVESQYI